MAEQPMVQPGLATAAGESQAQTRFGVLKYDRGSAYAFPKGIIGMPEKQEFCLLNYPNPKFSKYKLLHCTVDDDLTFIVLPDELSKTMIDAVDIDEACKELQMTRADVALLLIVTVSRQPDGLFVSANVRAPIFMDARKKQGIQYVLPNPKYLVRQSI